MTSFSGIDDDDVVSESTGLVSNARPPVPRTAAIPIYQEDSEDDVTQQQDDDSDSSSDEYSRDNSVAGEDRNSEDFMCNASPGTGSYVFDVDSWRPVPPPMLASSFDRRIRPSLRLQAKSGRLPSEQPSYGAIDCVNRKRRRTDGPTEDDAQGMSVAKRLMLAQKPAKTAHFSQKAIEASKTHPVDVPSASWRHKLARASVQWNAIFHAPRELWIIFILKLLSSCTLMFSMFLASAILNSQLSKLVGYIYQGGKKKIDTDQPSPTSVRFRFIDAYFSLSLILTMFLSQEFGLSDTSAGWTYGMYGLMSTVFGFVCGWVIDYLGVRVSLMVGGIVGALSRFILALTPSHRTAHFMLYTALPFSECLGIPIMTIGIKRYTNARNRTFAFSIFYSMMNVAALIVGPVVDWTRSSASEGVVVDLHSVGFEATFELSALRVIVLTSAVATAAMLLGVAAGIREIDVDDSGNITEFEPNRSESPYEQTMAVLREPAFWRLTVFTFLIVGVRLVFRHLDATLPKYLVRQFGPMAPFGEIYAINPFIVIWLVPVVGLMTRSMDSFTMILLGSLLSAVSPFWICLAPRFWTVILFMVTLSIGEAIYSPRVYEYTMEVSGHGVEGLYSSLSSAPLFSVKLLVGGMSGWLLSSFMPATVPEARNGALMWAIIGATSLISPISMFLLRDYLRGSSSSCSGTDRQTSRLRHQKGDTYTKVDLHPPQGSARDVEKPKSYPVSEKSNFGYSPTEMVGSSRAISASVPLPVDGSDSEDEAPEVVGPHSVRAGSPLSYKKYMLTPP